MEGSLLDKIRRSDRHVRIYALNGLAFTLANEAEDIMFWCFLTASGLDWQAAVEDFYAGQGPFKHKRQRTHQAITDKLAGTEDLIAWQKLNERIQALLGKGSNSSLRNLIGHNAVALNLYSDTFDDPFGVDGVIVARPEVSQKRAMIGRGSRKAITVGEPEMEAYCESLIALVRDLDRFGRDVLEGDPIQRLQYP